MSDRLRRLFAEFGQSPWLDNLKRSYITSGELVSIRDTGIRGLTSNPTIFQKAIQGSNDYSVQFKSLTKQGLSPVESYWQLVLKDIHGALDVFAPLYESSKGLDGFVSVEVDPALAHDQANTLASARDLHIKISRPNVMIKIPATHECIPAIASMISEARNVNVTLIFSLERYQQVMDAYIDGIERLANDQPNKVGSVSSVASFFISRVDTEIDRLLATSASKDAASLLGTAAINQAKLAYEMFQKSFSGPRWNKLEKMGAKVQRPLWASTSTKNPNYPDTLYVDNLIGEHTVNTLPDSTVEAFTDHGNLKATILLDLDQAHEQWKRLETSGVNVSEVATKLEREGVSSFQKSFNELIDVLAQKAAELK
ncbi:MAG: transaldolase [Actinomycetota bacterium]|nr:transaldolase [Actinomycetota bacterium]